MHTVKTLIEELQSKLESGECEPDTPIAFNVTKSITEPMLPMQATCLSTMGGFVHVKGAIWSWEPDEKETHKLVFVH
jgi:hypothetical protein